MKRLLTAGIIGGLYMAFWRWYTNSQPPLTPAEIETYLEILVERGAEPEVLERMRYFLEHDTGRGFVMVNLIKLNETPGPVAGVTHTAMTSRQMLDRYSGPFLSGMLRRASHPIAGGQVAADALDLWGIDGAESWTQAALVRYRSRRDLIQGATAAEFPELYPFKKAAIEKTIAVPADPWFYAGDPRLIGGLVALIAGLALMGSRTHRRSR